MRPWRNGRRCGLKRKLSALGEIQDVELLKVGETFKSHMTNGNPEPSLILRKV